MRSSATVALIIGVAAMLGLAATPTGPGELPARPQTAAREPDGLLVLAVLSPERTMVANPRTGRTVARELPGGTLCHGPVLAVADHVVFSGIRRGRPVALATRLGYRRRARSLGPAAAMMLSSNPGRLWLGRWKPIGDTGRMSYREVDVAGRVYARMSGPLDATGSIEGIVQGRFLTLGGSDLTLWPARAERPSVRVRHGWPIAIDRSRFAWCTLGCRRIGVWDGARRTFDPPDGLRPVDGDAAFSPDGRRLALATARGSRVAVIDVGRGTWRVVPGARTARYGPLAWSPSGGWLYFAGQRHRLLASRGGVERARRLPIRTGGTVMSIASTPGSAAR